MTSISGRQVLLGQMALLFELAGCATRVPPRTRLSSALAKPLIVAIEAALTVSVAVALALLVAGPARKAPAR